MQKVVDTERTEGEGAKEVLIGHGERRGEGEGLVWFGYFWRCSFLRLKLRDEGSSLHISFSCLSKARSFFFLLELKRVCRLQEHEVRKKIYNLSRNISCNTSHSLLAPFTLGCTWRHFSPCHATKSAPKGLCTTFEGF